MLAMRSGKRLTLFTIGSSASGKPNATPRRPRTPELRMKPIMAIRQERSRLRGRGRGSGIVVGTGVVLQAAVGRRSVRHGVPRVTPNH